MFMDRQVDIYTACSFRFYYEYIEKKHQIKDEKNFLLIESIILLFNITIANSDVRRGGFSLVVLSGEI